MRLKRSKRRSRAKSRDMMSYKAALIALIS